MKPHLQMMPRLTINILLLLKFISGHNSRDTMPLELSIGRRLCRVSQSRWIRPFAYGLCVGCISTSSSPMIRLASSQPIVRTGVGLEQLAKGFPSGSGRVRNHSLGMELLTIRAHSKLCQCGLGAVWSRHERYGGAAGFKRR